MPKVVITLQDAMQDGHEVCSFHVKLDKQGYPDNMPATPALLTEATIRELATLGVLDRLGELIQYKYQYLELSKAYEALQGSIMVERSDEQIVPEFIQPIKNDVDLDRARGM